MLMFKIFLKIQFLVKKIYNFKMKKFKKVKKIFKKI